MATTKKKPTPAKKPEAKKQPLKKLFKYDKRYAEVELERALYDVLYNFCPQRGPIQRYVSRRAEITAQLSRFQNPSFMLFVKFLEKEAPAVEAGFKRRQAEGLATFDDLLLLFKQGQEVIITDEDFGSFGAIVTSFNVHWGWGVFFKLEYECISSSGGKASRVKRDIKMPAFSDVRKITSLPFRPITPEEKAQLAERGKKFRDIVMTPTHMVSTGNLFVPHWFGYQRYRNHGRVMIDARALKQAEPNYYDDIDRHDDQERLDVIEDQFLWMTEPRVFGFSFSLKKWGEMAVSDLQDISYRRDAYQRLVLDEEVKSAVLALVSRGNMGFSDVIDGKGGGCIFLLHGNPGVGKTMTAEAVADYLGRPLYSVSAGELGVQPRELEASLRNILDIAATWNAVILLDEADVYLEQRDEKDIVRNAMVGVFLRMLEYHSGVMFLTTNRVRHFDQAFFSRISMILHYQDMTPSSRAKVWLNLLEAAGISGVPVDKLAAMELNGRQIKNTIRAAQALASKKDVSEEQLFDAIRVTTEGAKDIAPRRESNGKVTHAQA